MWRTAYGLLVVTFAATCQSAPASLRVADGGQGLDEASDDGVDANPVDLAAPCGDTDRDPWNCGICGRNCLGGACLEGQCQAIAVVQGLLLSNWDGIDPWGITLAGDSVYYSDDALGAGYVWKVAKVGGIASPVIEIRGADATAEYCLGGAGEKTHDG